MQNARNILKITCDFIILFRFDYECPAMYNEADFVISILNSDDENVKRNVEEMCKLSSTEQQTNTNYDLFNSQVKCSKFLEYNIT